MRGQTFTQWERLITMITPVVAIGLMDEVGLGVEQQDLSDFSLKYLAYFITDNTGNGLHIKVAGHGLADAVDNGKFSGVLFGFGQSLAQLLGHPVECLS